MDGVVSPLREKRRISRRSATLQSDQPTSSVRRIGRRPARSCRRGRRPAHRRDRLNWAMRPDSRAGSWVPLPDRAVVAAGEDRPVGRRDDQGSNRRTMTRLRECLAAVATSQSRIIGSAPVEASVLPSGENDSDATHCWCAGIRRSS